jgi:hypothetical protein
MELDSLVQIFGGAGATFYVMWLWLKSVQTEKKELQTKLELVEEKRISELREMLPLLSDASKGLQDVIASKSSGIQTMVGELKTHIDEKVIEITEACKKK